MNNNMPKTFILFLAFNIQAFLSDQNDDHGCNTEVNAIKQLKNEMQREMKQFSRKLEDQHEEILALKKEMEEILSNAVTRDLPYKVTCAFTNQWTEEGKTVSYDYILSDFDNSGELSSNITCPDCKLARSTIWRCWNTEHNNRGLHLSHTRPLYNILLRSKLVRVRIVFRYI